MQSRAKVHGVLAVLTLAAFVWLMVAVITGPTLPFDEQIRNQIHQQAVSSLTTAMMVATNFGSTAWILACTGVSFLLLRKEGQNRTAIVLLILIAGSIAMENALKFAVHRVRPTPFFGLVSPTTYSFPSGHALLSTTLYGTLGCIATRSVKRFSQRVAIWLAAAATVATISFSRVYLGVHYPTDVAGGFLIACFWVNTVLAFAKLP